MGHAEERQSSDNAAWLQTLEIKYDLALTQSVFSGY
jgi:hypothetical protein